jgi:hypothetical protein
MNRIRAEGMREAEKIVRKRVQWVSNGQGSVPKHRAGKY